MTKLPDRYDAKTREKFWQNYWREKQIYKWLNDKPKSETFVIDTPPPTVSGLLHMGHVFSYTQADFVARFQRMSGKDVFYPMGFDDNGLPTERLVEKIIGKKAGVFESENGHGSFVNKCRGVVDEAEKEFEALFNEVALSVDWEQKYQTISPESQKISQASFLDLYRKNLVEKKFEPVFWDISDRTALAQADLVDKESKGEMYYMKFDVDQLINDNGILKGLKGYEIPLEIMTTRPELLPACVAVMINANHKNEDGSLKWQELLDRNKLDEDGEGFTGYYASTAIFKRKVPIIADNDVKVDKGTGAVMCCTFGDETDIKWWKKYELDLQIILETDGKSNWNTLCKAMSPDRDSSYNRGDEAQRAIKRLVDGDGGGKKIKDIRQEIVIMLTEQNLLTRPKEEINHSVKCAERSGVPIEILVVPQWFIKILDKKEELKAKAIECNWYPQYMKVRIDQWIDGLAWDWCISRQRFFGVKFPVWHVAQRHPHYEQEFKTIVADVDQLPIDPMKDLPKFLENPEIDEWNGYYRKVIKNDIEYSVRPETDIMDTWATSSISPQLSSKGISSEICFDKERHEKLFPADMRPQAHEIIRTWAFYTLVKATLHQNSVPWKNLMISGWCLAADKTKMSKSKGNVVTPTALIEEKGSDIVRYWASTSHLGADTAYSEEVFKIGQKLITKLFNAAKFASMNFGILDEPVGAVANHAQRGDIDTKITEAADLWILSKLQLTTKQATESFEKFEYARAREAIEEFFWKDFCDNYLEICKVRSYGLAAEKLAGVELSEAQKSEIHAKQQSAILTLRICLNTILKLFAPFIPHITDEIYSTIFVEEFAKTKSINARKNWPKLGEEFFNQEFYDIGEAALAVIFEVRKFKSEQNISMKTTVQKIAINCEKDLSKIAQDLENVCNAQMLELKKEGQFVEVIL